MRRLTPRTRSFVLLLGALGAMAPIGWDMITPAMPEMRRAFASDAAAVQMTISLYLIGFAIGQLLWGALADRFGRRPAVLAGIAVFTVAGIGCVFADDLLTLVTLRFLQGFGGCAGIVMARAIVRDSYDRQDGARALSFVTVVQGLAPVVAPFIGGLLTVHFGWNTLFIVLASCGLVMLALVGLKLPETLPRPDKHALRFGRLAANWRRFLTDPRCLVWTALSCLVYGGIFSFISGSSFALQEAYGVTPDMFGVYFLFAAIALSAGSFANAWLLRRLSAPRIMTIGYVLQVAAGVAMLAAGLTRWGGAAAVAAPIAVYVFGFAFTLPNAIAAALEPVPDMAGNASALLGFLQMIFAAFTGWLANALFDGTAAPLAGVLLGCAVLGALLYAATGRIRA